MLNDAPPALGVGDANGELLPMLFDAPNDGTFPAKMEKN